MQEINIQQENIDYESDNLVPARKQTKNFFEEKDNLQQAEKEMQLVTQKYNELLKNFDGNQLLNTAIIYDYRKAQTEYLLKTNNTEISEKDRKIVDKNFSEYIKNNLGIECESSDIGQLIKKANVISKPVLDIIKEYKEDLSSTYMKYSPVLRHATNIEGLSKLNASHNRENQYLNEVVNAVFASSGYNDLENYIGRSNVGGMQVVGNIVVYPNNPLSLKQKIAKLLQKSDLLMNIPFLEKFVDRQLNVLSPATEQLTSTVNSSRESFENWLSNKGEHRNLPPIQRMSDTEKIETMRKRMEQNQESNKDNELSL